MFFISEKDFQALRNCVFFPRYKTLPADAYLRLRSQTEITAGGRDSFLLTDHVRWVAFSGVSTISFLLPRPTAFMGARE